MLTREQRDWAMDNLGLPFAPVKWFGRLKTSAGPAGWLLTVLKWLVVIVWAVGFIWVWFPVFAVLFLWEGFTSASPPSSSTQV